MSAAREDLAWLVDGPELDAVADLALPAVRAEVLEVARQAAAAPRGYSGAYQELDVVSKAAAVAQSAITALRIHRQVTDLGFVDNREYLAGGPPSTSAEPSGESNDAWPAPPAEAAFHGVAGDLVGAMADHTEADPVAILGTVLTMFGAVAGHRTGFYLGSHQAANLFIVLVGDSSSGRKGTALSVGRDILRAAWPDWESILVPGLGSGEGLIGHLQRAAQRDEPDHRALVLETEMARLLGVMKREGSILSPTLRDAWDGVPLGRFLAREDSLVPWHHVGCLAHVTPAELRDKLTDVDAANGFGNRFLWLAVRRTRLVPFPVAPAGLIGAHVEALHRAIAEAQTPGELAFTAAAASRWEDLYAELAARPRYGLAGALTARAEAHIARLALVYALLDRSRAIDVAHLAAAEALWDYADRSARFLFGDSTGDAVADLIRAYLAEGPASREDLRQATGVREATRLASAIQLLVGLGLAKVSKGQARGRAGRRPDIVELLPFPALPAFPPRGRAQGGPGNGAPLYRGNAGNVDSSDADGRARGTPEVSQVMQGTPGPVQSVGERMADILATDEPEDLDEPADLGPVLASMFGDLPPAGFPA
jgi:hypothetical protein